MKKKVFGVFLFLILSLSISTVVFASENTYIPMQSSGFAEMTVVFDTPLFGTPHNTSHASVLLPAGTRVAVVSPNVRIDGVDWVEVQVRTPYIHAGRQGWVPVLVLR